MAEPHIKQVVLTGGAADEFTGDSKRGAKKSGGRRTKKSIEKENGITPMTGGASLSPPTSTSSPPIPTPTSTPSTVSNPPSSMISKGLPAPIPVTPPPRITGSALSDVASRLLPTTSQTGGADTRSIRVELKKKNQTKRVQLQPKKPDAPVKGGAHSSKKPQTKKSRKITLGIKSLHKRMDRAKKMTRKVKEMPLDKLKEHLIQKKLIQPTSKAPESVLRQIAADAQIVAGKAL